MVKSLKSESGSSPESESSENVNSTSWSRRLIATNLLNYNHISNPSTALLNKWKIMRSTMVLLAIHKVSDGLHTICSLLSYKLLMHMYVCRQAV